MKLHLIPESEALRACAKGVVEGKTARFDLINADPTVRARKAHGKIHWLCVCHIDDEQSVCQLQYVFYGICQSLLNAVFHHQTIHDNLDVVLDVFVQCDLLGQLVHIAVHLRPHISAAPCLLKQLGMGSFAAAHDRCQQLYFCALRQLHDLIDHLIDTLSFDLTPAFRAVGNSDARVEQSEIVINFRYCSHRGSRIAVCGFLIYGYRGRQSLDLFYIGLFHLSEELARIGGQGLHIAALSLRIDRIKGEGGFSRTAQTCQHYKFIARYVQIDVFEVVLAGSPDFDVFSFLHDIVPFYLFHIFVSVILLAFPDVFLDP